ncbi:MAG TPA: hypothetical protein PLD14_02965 [Candidatus Pacearchaeota archaeon]|nr:hypothetical protein [Candidatus Pacearchaeota archaeon]HPR80160.1 hypothetical protein [Candidatus Pacearchaeota archaeon]
MNNFETIPDFENLDSNGNPLKENIEDKKETIERASEEKTDTKKENSDYLEKRENLQEGRAYEKRALDLSFFHSTHFPNFLKILDKGAISSGYSLIKEGLKPGSDFEAKTGGMSGALEKLKKDDKEISYNGIFFAVGGIPEEGSGLYYSDACPVSFLLDRKGLKHYAFGTTHEGAGDAIISNKNPERPTKINLSHLSAVFLPEDVYFNNEGKIIKPPSERFSHISFAENFNNNFKRIEKDVEKYQDLVKKIKDLGFKKDVEDEIKNIYLTALKNAHHTLDEELLKYNDSSTSTSQDVKSLERYKNQIEWGGFSGLLSLDSSSIQAINRHDQHRLSSDGINANLGNWIILLEDMQKYAKLQNRKIVAKDFAVTLIENLPSLLVGFCKEDQDRSKRYYEQNKEKVNALVEDINKRLNLKGSDAINPLDFETIKGRFFYSGRSGLYDFIDRQNDWEEYEKKGKDNGYQTSRDFIINLISKKGGIIKENNGELLIDNYEKENLPPKIVFFSGDLADTVNKYTSDNYRLKLPSHKLPYDESPTSSNKTRIDAAKAINKMLENLTKKERANYHYIGNVPTTFWNTEVYSRTIGHSKLKKIHKNRQG